MQKPGSEATKVHVRLFIVGKGPCNGEEECLLPWANIEEAPSSNSKLTTDLSAKQTNKQSQEEEEVKFCKQGSSMTKS